VLRTLLALAMFFVAPVVALAAPVKSFDVGSVHVEQHGTGTVALVLIPGLTDSGAVWSTTVAHYEGTHTIYVLTLPGFGGRAAVPAPVLDTVDRDIAAFLPQANRPVVIGHSLGGFLAIRLAEEHGNLIRGAIAIDGLPVFAGMESLTPDARSATAASIAGRIGASTPSAFEAAERTQIGYMTKPENVATALSFSQGAQPATTATYMQEMMSSDLRPGLSKITVPLLEIGPFDAAIDTENPYIPMATLAAKQAYYAKLLANDPTAKVEMVDNSRHFIMLDQPAALFALIDAFLSNLPA
jgi:pimeloyl-ACP methyl ester carboxylesterase